MVLPLRKGDHKAIQMNKRVRAQKYKPLPSLKITLPMNPFQSQAGIPLLLQATNIHYKHCSKHTKLCSH